MSEARRHILAGTMLIAAFAATVGSAAMACTGITLTGRDGTVVFGRTLEWGPFDLKPRLVAVPRGARFTAHDLPDDREGMSWVAKYGAVGIDVLEKDILADAMNETGLTVGLFYLPGFADYQAYDPAQAAISMAPTDLSAFLVTQFATIDEVRAALPQVRVVPVVEPALGIPAPVHWIVTEPDGDAIVIEYLDGALTVFDAPLGVITNAPSYDWHLTNLRNYLNLSPVAVPTLQLTGAELAPLGAGSGMIGLPGDFTPPSRFVRAVAFSQTARPTVGGYDTVREVFRILDNFNVPLGAAEGADDAPSLDDLLYSATQWTAASDQKERVFYYHTQFSRTVRMVDLKTIDFAAIGDRPLRRPLDESREPDVRPVDLTP